MTEDAKERMVLSLRKPQLHCASPRLPARIVLDQESSPSVVIGRSKKLADVIVDVPRSIKRPACLMSRQHARLRWHEKTWYIRDLSKNGVFVNGERLEVSVEYALVQGDLIFFGGGPSIDYRLGVAYSLDYESSVAVVTPRATGIRKRVVSSHKERPTEKKQCIYREARLMTASAAACAAADARASAAEASLSAGLIECRSRCAAAVDKLSCSACHRSLVSALFLGCGHLVDESCYLRAGIEHAAANNFCAIPCPACGEISSTAPVRQATAIDAALDVLITEPNEIKVRKQRLDDLLSIRREAHALCPAAAASSSPVSELLLKHQLLAPDAYFAQVEDDFFQNQSHQDTSLANLAQMPPDINSIQEDNANHQEDNANHQAIEDQDLFYHQEEASPTEDAAFLICDGCGEIGHSQRHCPHRSDLSEIDDEADDAASMEL